ncbi:uncharacterized protein METZ01_LOCUS368225 [marine metagenome]|uniref:Uncharacterized protein n=1 Tax=marine metagenome TaxID=408172 RepID=A0A382T2A0_9ZZZZ
MDWQVLIEVPSSPSTPCTEASQWLPGVISTPSSIREGEDSECQTEHCEVVVLDPKREAHANFVSQEKHKYQNTSDKGYLSEKTVNSLHQKPLDPTGLLCNKITEAPIKPANMVIIQI